MNIESIELPQLCPSCGATTKEGQAGEKLRTKRENKRKAFLSAWMLLSEREREVMLMIIRGLMPADICTKLGIRPKTVSTYRTRAMEKLKMKSTAEIAVAAHNAGFLE